jgi:hypothetical protein
MTVRDILILINKPLSKDKKLNEERLDYLENNLRNFTEPTLRIFYKILKDNSVEDFKYMFKKEDYNTLINSSVIFKENFNYMMLIINCIIGYYLD